MPATTPSSAATATTCCSADDGTDTLDGGAGDNVLIDGEKLAAGVAEDQQWLEDHTEVVNGDTVLDTGEKVYAIPDADITRLTPTALGPGPGRTRNRGSGPRRVRGQGAARAMPR